jgi:hypothetical protein
MSSTELETKNDCAGEDKQQFSSQSLTAGLYSARFATLIKNLVYLRRGIVWKHVGVMSCRSNISWMCGREKCS